VVGAGGACVLLAILGLSLASLLSPGAPPVPDPEPIRPAPPPRSPSDSPVRPRMVEPPPPPSAVAPAPAPAPVESRFERVDAGPLPVPEQLRLRRELIRSMAALRQELGRCPAQPAPQPVRGRAALVLELRGVAGGAQVTRTSLEADMPVNEVFVGCVRTTLQGRTLAAKGIGPGVPLRFSVPLGPGGNSLGLNSASLTPAADRAAPAR
jgi:hypothetical protein